MLIFQAVHGDKIFKGDVEADKDLTPFLFAILILT
jgi:hypothetical protein